MRYPIGAISIAGAMEVLQGRFRWLCVARNMLMTLTSGKSEDVRHTYLLSLASSSLGYNYTFLLDAGLSITQAFAAMHFFRSPGFLNCRLVSCRYIGPRMSYLGQATLFAHYRLPLSGYGHFGAGAVVGTAGAWLHVFSGATRLAGRRFERHGIQSTWSRPLPKAKWPRALPVEPGHCRGLRQARIWIAIYFASRHLA